MLFKKSDTVKLYAQLSGTIDMESIKITMESVEDKYLLPVLGKKLFNPFINAYNTAQFDVDFTDEKLLKLLDKCRRVTAPMFCYHFAPKADVQVSNSGVQRTETDKNKTAYQYQNTNYRLENFAEGERAIEKLIEFLEDNKADYPDWKDSAEFKRYNQLFIKTAADFNEQYPSHTPYRNYWAMRSKMVDVETINIKDFLGQSLFADLKNIDQSETLTFSIVQKELVTKIKKIIAYNTVAFSIPFLSVKVEADGISVMAASNFSTNDERNTRGGSDDKALTHLIESCNSSAKMWIENTIQFLTDNKSDFSNWKGFDVVPEPVQIKNDFKTVFGF